MSNFSHHGKDKKVYVEKMFNDISKRYDLFNTISSFGLDRYWRRKLVSALYLDKTKSLLDVATGTGDVVFSMYKAFKVKCTGIDIAEKMIKLANIKRQKKYIDEKDMIFVKGDAENLDFPDNTFDALTISFGFRNLGDYDLGLKEFYRVLKPGGKIAILEFSRPHISWFSPLFKFYFKNIVPLLGAMLARKDAFLYLPESVDYFLGRKEVCSKMESAGYNHVTYADYTFGVVTIYIGQK